MRITDKVRKADCCGCKVCQEACPASCITAELDEEGFAYPIVDNYKCLDCGRCLQVCPIINIPLGNEMQQEVFAAWSKDKSIRHNGSSGGLFEIFANEYLSSGGVVFGAAFDACLQVKHTCAVDRIELKSLCKSKYIQSDMLGCYVKVCEQLKSGRKVLFVGTPCQVAALQNYLGKPYDNLALMDLVCHGVPSQSLFNKCMQHEEDTRGIRIEGYQFRTKVTNGSTPHYYTETFFKNGRHRKRISFYYRSPFYYGFQKYITLRPSCYRCRFSMPRRVADITIADFHGISKYLDVDRLLGVSMVIINTPKGLSLFNLVNGQLRCERFDLQIAVENNDCLSAPTKMPSNRTEFFEDLKSKDFVYTIKRHLRPRKMFALTLYYSLPGSIRAIVRRMLLGGT
jgi:coenzyme F420-reducing hydrogenase beta subunit